MFEKFIKWLTKALEISLAGQKEEPIAIAIEDPNKALFLSLLAKDLAR